jgi:hypothetical protein
MLRYHSDGVSGQIFLFLIPFQPDTQPKKKEINMDVIDYCKAMETEMTAWKAKLYDTMRKIDKLGTSEREKILPNIEDLHMMLEEMEERVGQLRNECPSEWSPEKKGIDAGVIDMRGKYEETMEFIGKAAPVSIPG